ncbi:MAG: sigma-70 family RNA polymerase sigma factor [Planctomycetota bacterium]
MTDTDALRAYIDRRDPEAFAYLVRTYQGMVYSACRRRLNEPSDIEDAVQATFIKLAEKAQSIRSSVSSWLYRCALNAAADIGRSQTRRQRHEQAYAETVATAEDRHAHHHLQQHIDDALLCLDEDQRALIVEHFFLGRTQADLASSAGISATVVSRRMARAVSDLRGHLRASSLVLPAGVVTGYMAEQSAATAVPATLSKSLVKIGVAGVGPAAAGGTSAVSVGSSLGGSLMAAVKAKPVLSSVVALFIFLTAGLAVVGVNNLGQAAPPVASTPSPPPIGTPPTAPPPPLSLGVVISRAAVDVEVASFAGEYAKDSETAKESERRFAFAWHSRVADHVREELEVPYELVAVIDPGTAEDELIQRRVNTLGVTRTILGNDAEALAELDVVLMTATGELGEDQVEALLEAVRRGTGLLAIGWLPDRGNELLGVGDTGYVVTFLTHTAELVTTHPAFEGFDVGETFDVNINGTVVNPRDVTPLLMLSEQETGRLEEGQRFDLHQFPAGFRFIPLFVNEVGQGRVLYSATAGHMQGGRFPSSIMELTDGGIVADGIAWLAEGKALAEAAADNRSAE